MGRVRRSGHRVHGVPLMDVVALFFVLLAFGLLAAIVVRSLLP